ncbi:MAG: glutamyl-tRNA reductase [Acidobacteria bacterium]|nr:glutamyl-tRNA reductase [Acidobacteriota bacterium]
MEIVFVGWNHRTAVLDLRERLSLTPDRAREALNGMFAERLLVEGAIVSTCNRAEIYGVSEHADPVPELHAYLSRFHSVDHETLSRAALSGRGSDTVRHLFRVASGLDSLVLGEAEILGQIREAHRRAAEMKTSRAVVNRLFTSALECGKRVRTETSLGTRPASVPGIALQLAGRVFEELAGRRVLLIGAGEVVELTLRLLADAGVTGISITNRSPRNAEALATMYGGNSIPWDDRESAFSQVDIVLSATSSPEPVVKAAGVKRALSGRRRGPLLVLDLAVPRDIDPAIDSIADVYRYDVDALEALARKNTEERAAEVPHAEAVVEEGVRRFHDWYSGLQTVDVVKGLREKMETLRRAELEKHSGRLSRLSIEDRQLVERVTEGLIAKILHEPTVSLKQGALEERLDRAAAARALFKLDEERE